MGSQPIVDEVLEKFVHTFVVIFESYFDEYYKRLIEKIPKNGKFADSLDGVAGIISGVTEIFEGPIKAAGIVTFEVFRKTAGIIGNKCNRDDLKKLSKQLRHFNERPDDLRDILIESGFEIFRSFESQFTRLKADDNSWKTAMEKVAEDVVNRIIHQLKKNPDKELSVETTLEGFLFGESKTYRSPNSGVPNFHRGHSVKIDEFEIKTSDLFKKVGLMSGGDYYRYKSKSWSSTDLNNCGFRLLYTWEDIKTYTNYTKLCKAPPDSYKYLLTDEIIKKVKLKVTDELKNSKTTIYLENILDNMKNEASRATEELIELLTQNADAVDRVFEEFNNVNKSLDVIQQATSKANHLAEANQQILLDLQMKVSNLQDSNKNNQSSIVFNVPEPSDLFTGRVEELKRLDESLQIGLPTEKKSKFPQMTCVTGLGGIGKSEIVKRYICDCRQKSEYIQSMYVDFVWVNAESEISLTNSFCTLAEEELGINLMNGLGKPKDIKQIMRDVYKRLGGRTGVLVVFDNAENQEYLRQFLPLQVHDGNAPCFVLTSRDTEWDKRIGIVHLQGLNTDEAVQFVKKGLECCDESEDEDVLELIQSLQNFPLALQQAISYIAVQREMNGNYSVSHYMKEFNEKTKYMLSSEEFKTFIMDNTYSKTTFTTWNITVDSILNNKEHGRLAVEIMNMMAYMFPDNIHRDLFFSLPSIDDDDVRSAVRLLVKYSMVTGESNQSILKIHRLVQQVVRMKLVGDESKVVIIAVRVLLKSNYPGDDTSASYFKKKMLLPHFETFYGHLKDWIVRKPEDRELIERTFIIELLLNMGDMCTILRKSCRAKQVYNEALEIVRKRDGTDDQIAAAIILVDLSRVLDDLGEYEEQLKIIEQAIPILQKYYNNDSRFANALEKKGVALSKLGNHVEAEEIFRTILSMYESYGDELGIATTKINLSSVHALGGDIESQRRMLEEALPVFEKYYSTDHIKLATVRFQLATIDLKLGECDHVIELIGKSLQVFEKVYGEESQATGRLFLVLGAAYGRNGNHEKYKEYAEKALQIFKNHYGDEHHIDVARCKSFLADAIGDLGDKQEKLRLLRSALTDYENFFDGGNWETAYLLVRIAEAFNELGQREETKKAFENAITMMENHPRGNEEEDRAYINSMKHIISRDYQDLC